MVVTTRSVSQESIAGREEIAEVRVELVNMKADIADLKILRSDVTEMTEMMKQMWGKIMGETKEHQELPVEKGKKVVEGTTNPHGGLETSTSLGAGNPAKRGSGV